MTNLMTSVMTTTPMTMTLASKNSSNPLPLTPQTPLNNTGTTTVSAPARNFSAEFPILSSYGKVITPYSDTTVCVQEEKIKKLATILNSVENRNLFLRGKAGVGKTATIYALAKYLASDACKGRLRNMVIAQIDLNRLKSVGNSPSVIEKSIKDIWDEAARSKNVILFIDEGHRIATGGADSIGNILKPLVTSGEVPVILATTEDEFRRYIDPDLALKRRFHPIHISEPKGDALLAILKSKGKNYAQKLGVDIGEEIYKKTIELADRYIHETANPDKSIRLLERACSVASLRDDIPRDDGGDAISVSLDDLSEALEIISNVKLPKQDVSVSMESISCELSKKIRGQEIAVEKVGEFISQHLDGLFKSAIPASLALLGPCGCGKTLLAREIASRLNYKKSAGEIIEIKMSALRGYDAMGLLIGKRIDDRVTAGTLTDPLRENPNRFIIVDEIEDMPDDVVSIFEQMMTSGTVRDVAGNNVHFKNAVVVFTGDIGKGKRLGFLPTQNLSALDVAREQEEEMFGKLREKFSGEFCSNINVLVPFVELSKPVVMDIIRSACDAEISDDACEHIAGLCEYATYGAREVRNRLNGIMRKLGQPSRIILENGVLRAAREERISHAVFSNNLS